MSSGDVVLPPPPDDIQASLDGLEVWVHQLTSTEPLMNRIANRQIELCFEDLEPYIKEDP